MTGPSGLSAIPTREGCTSCVATGIGAIWLSLGAGAALRSFIPKLPTCGLVAMTVAEATRAYAAYLNTPRGILEPDEQELHDQDLAKARAAMERAWLVEAGLAR